MPKVVVYVRADDARMIEAAEGLQIGAWVRAIVREEIQRWHRHEDLEPKGGEDAVQES